MKKYGRHEILIMYAQSVLVWNLPVHFGCVVLITYFLIEYGAALLSQADFYQISGATLTLLATAPLARRFFSRTSRQLPPQGTFWPQDCVGMSAEKLPLGAKLFFSRVKLLSIEDVMLRVATLSREGRRALRATRVLRYSSPTQFALNSLALCAVMAALTSVWSGKQVVMMVTMTLLIAPGLAVRKVPQKIRRALETKSWGRILVETVAPRDNLNLEETNTSKIVTFVSAMDQSNLPRVVVREAK